MEAPNNTKEGRAVAWVSRAHPFHALYMNCLHPSYSSEETMDGAMEFVCKHCFAIFYVEPRICEHKRMTQNRLWCHDCCTPSKLHSTLLEQRGRAPAPRFDQQSTSPYLSGEGLQRYIERAGASNVVKLIASVDRYFARTKQIGRGEALQTGHKNRAAQRLHVVGGVVSIRNPSQ